MRASWKESMVLTLVNKGIYIPNWKDLSNMNQVLHSDIRQIKTLMSFRQSISSNKRSSMGLLVSYFQLQSLKSVTSLMCSKMLRETLLFTILSLMKHSVWITCHTCWNSWTWQLSTVVSSAWLTSISLRIPTTNTCQWNSVAMLRITSPCACNIPTQSGMMMELATSKICLRKNKLISVSFAISQLLTLSALELCTMGNYQSRVLVKVYQNCRYPLIILYSRREVICIRIGTCLTCIMVRMVHSIITWETPMHRRIRLFCTCKIRLFIRSDLTCMSLLSLGNDLVMVQLFNWTQMNINCYWILIRQLSKNLMSSQL